jgi:AcrR family transcriptional regulator
MPVTVRTTWRILSRQTCLITSGIPHAVATSYKRQQIVETAYALFKSAGFHATGIDRIIADADVAKMTMYRHFPSKDGLIVEVLRYRTERFDWYERWFRSTEFHGCLFAHALAEFGDARHPVFQAVAGHKDGLRQRLRSILEVKLPADRAESAATALFMLLEGATLLAQMGQGDGAIRDVRQAASSILVVPAKQR